MDESDFTFTLHRLRLCGVFLCPAYESFFTEEYEMNVTVRHGAETARRAVRSDLAGDVLRTNGEVSRK